VKADAPPILNAVKGASWFDKLSELQSGPGSWFGTPREADQLLTLQQFVEGLSLAELPEALQMLRRLQEEKPTLRGRDLEMRLLQRWAENEPKPAAAWALEAPDAIRLEAIGRTAGAWAERNLSDAAAWATQLPDGADRQSATLHVAAEAVYNDPRLALNLASTVPADAERDALIARASAAWAAKAPEDAVTWAKAIPDAALREQALSSVAVTWADSNPTAAAGLLSSLTSSELRSRVAAAIVQRLAVTDAKAVTEWVEQLPAGDLRETARNALSDAVERLDHP